jgi:hypothetical protein
LVASSIKQFLRIVQALFKASLVRGEVKRVQSKSLSILALQSVVGSFSLLMSFSKPLYSSLAKFCLPTSIALKTSIKALKLSLS